MKIIYALIAGSIVAVGIAIFVVQTKPDLMTPTSPHYAACMQEANSSSYMQSTLESKNLSAEGVCGCVADKVPQILGDRVEAHGNQVSKSTMDRFTSVSRSDAAMLCIYPNG